MPHVPRHKPRDKPVLYKPHKLYERQKKDAPKTSAQPVKRTTHENLTLHDWMTIFKFVGVMEVDESYDEKEGEDELTTKQVMEMCQQMEGLCIKHGLFNGSLDLAKHI